mgnify:FL=1
MSKKKKKTKEKGRLHVAIIIGEDQDIDRGPRGSDRQNLYHGGQPEFMGSAYPSADTDRISRGGGAAFAGLKFRGVK